MYMYVYIYIYIYYIILYINNYMAFPRSAPPDPPDTYHLGRGGGGGWREGDRILLNIIINIKCGAIVRFPFPIFSL